MMIDMLVDPVNLINSYNSSTELPNSSLSLAGLTEQVTLEDIFIDLFSNI